ncbi:MAG: family 10 glycosylhydrolase [Ignavibacteriales bacterium]|nr:family 10 glycosylhydrolase [Ignavibacteriales bacterium]
MQLPQTLFNFVFVVISFRHAQHLFLFVTVAFAGCGREVFTGKREARGVWMSRFEYANEQTRRNPEAAKKRIQEVFQRAREAKLNMVFFQVRGNGDAFYRSRHEPWSVLLTDTLGCDPGWDPLQFAVDEAHRHGLELHAWVNTFPVWRGIKPPTESTPRNVMLEHPEWLVCDSAGKPALPVPPNNEYIWVSPGIPAVRQHVVNVVTDIVENYDIDGIHFDYIRYPEGSPQFGFSHDSTSVARFNSAEGNPYKLSWDHWQREQVNQFVFDAYNSITTLKPWVKMSAAVIGKYMGSGWTSYFAVYQDPRRWMEVGKIDFIVPMVYWEREHPTHPFVPLITEWQDRVAYDRHVLPGLSAGLIRRIGWSELVAEIQEVRRRKLPGVVFFSSAGLGSSWKLVGVDAFPYWSNSPRMPWKDSIPPSPPKLFSAQAGADGISLGWESPDSLEPLIYNIYRSQTLPINKEDVFQLFFITARNVSTFLDSNATTSRETVWHYALSALDRLGNESELSNTVSVSLPSTPVASP